MKRTSNNIPKLKTEAERIRAREEARLISTAKKAGYFDRQVKTAELAQLFKTGLEALPHKFSQLRKLEDRIAMAQHKQSEDQRKLEARRKILLGAFLIAQAQHRPEEFTWVPKALEAFLDQNTNEKVVADNKKLLADWLKA